MICTRRKRSLNLRNETHFCYVLGEIDEIVGDWWSSLRSASHGLKRAQAHPLWISINELCARLTKAKVCESTHPPTILCDEILDNPKLRENPIFFALALSAAAQQMIHAASNAYTYCEKARTSWGLTYLWKECKAVFKEAETVKNVEARNNALCSSSNGHGRTILQLLSNERRKANDDSCDVRTDGTKWGF